MNIQDLRWKTILCTFLCGQVLTTNAEFRTCNKSSPLSLSCSPLNLLFCYAFTCLGHRQLLVGRPPILLLPFKTYLRSNFVIIILSTRKICLQFFRMCELFPYGESTLRSSWGVSIVHGKHILLKITITVLQVLYLVTVKRSW